MLSIRGMWSELARVKHAWEHTSHIMHWPLATAVKSLAQYSMTLCITHLAFILILELLGSLKGRCVLCQDTPTRDTAVTVSTRHTVVAEWMIGPFFEHKIRNTTTN